VRTYAEGDFEQRLPDHASWKDIVYWELWDSSVRWSWTGRDTQEDLGLGVNRYLYILGLASLRETGLDGMGLFAIVTSQIDSCLLCRI